MSRLLEAHFELDGKGISEMVRDEHLTLPKGRRG